MKLMRRMPRFSMDLPEQRDITGSDVPGADPEQTEARRPLPALASTWRFVGLEGKIVVVVMTLLTAALGSTCWLWASRIGPQVMEILGEQARETAVALSMAARPSMTTGDVAAMRAMGGDLLKARNILFVAFYDPSGKNIALASRQTQVRTGASEAFGEYLEVCQPVLEAGARGRASRLMGYVSVGISPTQEWLQVRRVNYLAMGIGCVVILGILPLAYLLVHGIFLPIRKLVRATNRIAGGDLDVAVGIDRSDAIGDLARSFNAMVATVKRQQQDLRQANHRLEEANDKLEHKVANRTSELEAANRRLSSEIAEKEKLRAELEELAATDALTGLYNRRHFNRVLDQMFAESERMDSDLACVMIDLDGYKQLNDTKGHVVGDQLLAVAGKVISANMRRMDVAARYGGDEFVLLLPHASAQEAARVTQRIRDEFGQGSAIVLRQNEGVSMSAGIASRKNNVPPGAEQLLGLSDAALYQAKGGGRNRVVIHAMTAVLHGKR
jgi:diguanylate cyclase (GGDEF)-like protein